MLSSHTPTRASSHVFELTGGHLCLDFANTVDNRPTLHTELLPNYSALLEWGQQAGVISKEDSKRLHRIARLRPQEADVVLRRAKRLREAIFRVFSAIANHQKAPSDALEELNSEIPAILAKSHLVATESGFAWGLATHRTPLESTLWWVSRSVVDLLTSDELNTIRECAASNCSWLFLDRSKNKIRRWCDIKTCGNRDKVRRFRLRHGTQSRLSHAD